MIIDVLIVDDHAIVRQGLRAMLDIQQNIHVVGEANNGATAIQLAQNLEPHVILMDLIMPDMSGVEATDAIREAGLPSKVLVLTSSTEDQIVNQALKAGALGYILKASRPTDLVRAIEQVASGQSVLDPLAAQVVFRQARQQDTLNTLTTREREVFDQLVVGSKNAEIAEALTISEATVRTHIASVIDKLDLRDRTHVVVYALKRGLVRLDDLP